MRGGLRRRLAVLVAAAVLPLAVYVGYQIVHLYYDLTALAIADTERDARLVSVSFNRFVHQMVEQGQSVGLAVSGGGLSRQEADTYVQSLGQHTPISDVTILTPSGELLATALPRTESDDLTSLPSFTRVLAGAAYSVSRVRESPGAVPGFVVFAPVGDPLEAVVAVSLDARDIGLIVPIETGPGVVLVTDREGVLAYSSDEAVLIEPGSSALGVPPVAAAIRGEEAVVTEVDIPGLSEPHAGSQVTVPEIGWTAGFYRPRSDVMDHVLSETITAIGSVLAILLVAGVLTRRFALRIVEPVDELTAASERLRGGDFDTPVESAGPGEVGLLAEGFRDMQASLRRTFASVTELAEAGRSLNAVVTLDDVGRAGVRHLAALLRAGAAVVTLLPAEGEGTRVWGLGTHDPAALSAESSRQILDADLIDRPRAKLLEGPGPTTPFARFLVSLPLVTEGERVGRADAVAMVVHGVAEFERADIELAGGFAQQLAASLVKARRFELDREIAETLQDSLLTEPFPIPGVAIGLVYRPAAGGARVGGDFYDLIPIDDHRVAVLLGDISGHGLTAAGATMAAKGALHSYALSDPSPSSVLERANVALAGQLEAGRFVTAFYALLDTTSGRLRYSNAGHPPPFLLMGRERAQSVLLSNAVPLGVDPEAVFTDGEVVLGEGDAIVTFTDGVTEARARDGGFFGDEGVSMVLARQGGLPAQGLATALAEEAERFAGHLNDDVAVLVLERLAVER